MDRRSQTLMIQGTTSDAGKTTLVAGLCRVFAQRGISVAPFKPQNMALNSAVTSDGGEIGRSQALQAYACGLEPHTDMNPILLKPNSDTGAQVIVHGHALDNMEAATYQRFKSKALTYAMSSYRRLRNQYDLIFVEGAGSPAEINLRENDVANMGFAEEADCPVVLVADIDRGGVFAHLVGTLALLSESELNRVAGFVINRFRGDITLLEDGLEWLEKETGKPVLAVLPYLHGLDIDQEDAIDPKQTMKDENPTNTLKIKVPVFPRISNHTDFDVLRAHPQVDLEFVGPDVIGESPTGQTILGQSADLGSADLIILPGSKSVQADLAWLKEQGLDKQIEKHLRYGGKLLGICGGFQMLGDSIADPHGIEGEARGSSALGYLEMKTTLAREKRLENITGRLCIGNQAMVAGYEIHCGISSGTALNAPLLKIDGREEGALSDDGQIAGTYVHGLFDSPDALVDLLDWAGLKAPQKIDRAQLRDQSLDRLADSIDHHFDWDTFDQVTGISLESQEAQTG